MRRLRGRAPTRHARTLRWHARALAPHGFGLVRSAADLPGWRELWAAAFVKNEG
jgi:hypothetical protein